MRIFPHDKAAEYRRLAGEIRAMAEHASFDDAHGQLLAAAKQLEALAELEKCGDRKTVPIKNSQPEPPLCPDRAGNGKAADSPNQPSRYFFDIDRGGGFIPDHEGLEMNGIEAARAEACGVLRDLAKGWRPAGDAGSLASRVRDESGRTVLWATLSLVVEYPSQAQD